MTGRTATVPLHDPVMAALVLSKRMPSEHLDEMIRLLLAAPDEVGTEPQEDE